MARPRRRAPFRRPVYDTVLARVHEPRRFIQVLAGPRQVGKTTLARQVMDAVGTPAHAASADDPALRDRAWLESQWQIGRARARDGGRAGGLLVIDEIQKVPEWSEVVKRLWDEDTRAELPLRVLLLGSAPILVQRGLTESLAGRFELIRVGHWSYAEMRAAFDVDLERFLVFGGYPGAAALVSDAERWSAYILDALVETSLARDVLLLTRVDKPMLLRQLFRLGCERSGDVVPYNRMLGRLDGAGNTTTLAHYLDLLAGAGMLTGLPKLPAGDRQRGSSPKLLAMNGALVTAVGALSFAAATKDADTRGRLVETAIGAHLVNSATPLEVGYWRDGDAEVDFLARHAHSGRGSANEPYLAIRVESGRRRETRSGLTALTALEPGTRPLIVGEGGVDIEQFLASDPTEWLH